MAALKLITPPASEPVTLQEAKNHLRVDVSDDDSLISTLITVARQKAEEFTRRSLITQTWELSLDGFQGIVYLPRLEIQSIVSVTVDGVALPVDEYQVGTVSGRVQFFGTRAAEQLDGAKIRYVAGYGDATTVPAQIKQAILQIVGHLYENRESQEIPGLALNLLQPYRVMML